MSGGNGGGRERIDPAGLPAGVAAVLEKLVRSGFSAYLVGGVVRDMIMGRRPRDYDIATSATPAQVNDLFARVIPTGEKHGTVTVLSGGLPVEVTTLRREGKYSDHRRPDSVEFTQSLKEDLSRRDFTINSLAAGPEGTLYDFFGGRQDLAGGVIRAVGSPGRRFREDALRMLRAIRFACQTGFYIEEKTLQSIRANRRLISRVSAERVREELNGILLGRLPDLGLKLIRDCGLLEYILPELADWAGAGLESGAGDLFGGTLEVVRRTPAKLSLRLAALLFPAVRAGLAVVEILERLKYDRRTVRSVADLVEALGGEPPGERKQIKKAIAGLGTEVFWGLLDLLAAGAAGVGTDTTRIRETARDILENREPLAVKDLAVNGRDLKRLGLRPGREMGDILNRLLDLVLDNPVLNEKQQLLDLARSWRDERD